MNFLNSIKRKLSIRFQYLIRKRNQKKQVESIIKKHNLNDPIEQQKVIDQFVIMQKNKRAFGRKTQEVIRDKVRFMIHYKLIKVV
jgi:ribosomal protein L35AE/L33A